jgi:dual specificity phosphatase 12
VLVAKGLYVGGIESLKHIDDLRITHVVTVLSGEGDDGTSGGDADANNTAPPPLVPPERPSDGYPVVSWRVPVDDLEDADLLTHLPATVQFLQMALRQPKARALVHCAQGVSRSAAVATALFMAARRLPRAEDALALMRAGARPAGAADHLRPNDGFLAQLDLFGEMGWQVDENLPAYRAYRAERAAAAWLEGGGGAVDDAAFFARLSGETEDGEDQEEGGADDSKTQQRERSEAASAPTTLYRCRRCRRLLATSRNEVPADWVRGKRTFGRMGRHTPAYAAAMAEAEAQQAELQQQYQQQEGSPSPSPSPSPAEAASSTVVFVEPMRWMRAHVVGGPGSGKLYCPREGCPQRVGSFAWSGISSPSGAWVTPAFALQLARVDAVVSGSSGGAAAAAAATGQAPAVPMIRSPVLLPGGGVAGIRAPVLLGRDARPPVIPVSRRAAGQGDGGAAAAAAAAAAKQP